MSATDSGTAANDKLTTYWKTFTEQLEKDTKSQTYSVYIPKPNYEITPTYVTPRFMQHPPTPPRASASRSASTHSPNIARRSNPGMANPTAAQMSRIPASGCLPAAPEVLPTPRIELSKARAVLTALIPYTGLKQTNIEHSSHEEPHALGQSTDATQQSTDKSIEQVRYASVVKPKRVHFLAQLIQATANGDDIDGNLYKTTATFDRQHVLIALRGGTWRSEYTFDETNIAITKVQEDAEWEDAWLAAIVKFSESLMNRHTA